MLQFSVTEEIVPYALSGFAACSKSLAFYDHTKTLRARAREREREREGERERERTREIYFTRIVVYVQSKKNKKKNKQKNTLKLSNN